MFEQFRTSFREQYPSKTTATKLQVLKCQPNEQTRITSKRFKISTQHEIIITTRLACTVSDIAKFHRQPETTSECYIRQGALQVIFECGFWRGNPGFILRGRCSQLFKTESGRMIMVSYQWSTASFRISYTISEIMTFSWKLEITSRCYISQGALYAVSYDGF